MTEIQNITHAVFKLSAAIHNYDNLCELEEDGDCNFFRGKFLADSIRTTNFFIHHTAVMCSNIAADQPGGWDLFVEGWYSDIDNYVEADSEEQKQLGLFLCKILSAINHLKEVPLVGKNKYFVEPLLKKLALITSSSYIKRLPIKTHLLDILTQEIDEISLDITTVVNKYK